MRPRLLDLFCCQGGASKGYHDAGFDVVGVDLDPQPNYPYPFVQADALDVLRDLADGRSRRWPTWNAPSFPVATLNASDFAAIHASPPCQSYLNLGGVNRAQGRAYEHPDLVHEVRDLLVQTRLPYVIENVVGAPLINPVRLCGSSFGLAVQRHRLFECSFPLMAPPCAHHLQTEAKYWTGWRPNGEKRLAKVVQVYGNAGGRDEWADAMGIDWMSHEGLAEAIPPAYTTHVGAYLMAAVNAPHELAA